jgi:NAD(P)-dependent dehydrogenase (short-subunit alcohol dehydrogenase family)
MPSLSSVRASNAAFSPPNLPVALFVGGTSGIGQATAQAFARSTNGEAHIIICGRNRSAAESTIASFPKSSQSQYEFVECDVSLLKNVHTTTSELLTKIPKLNFIVLSPGYLTSKLKDREDTSEGLPKKLVTDYYARWKFIYELLPLLKKAKEAGEDAKVLSVLAAGKGGAIDLEDLGMEKEYSLLKEMGNAATYNDLMIEVSSLLQVPVPLYVRTYLRHSRLRSHSQPWSQRWHSRTSTQA